MVYASCRVFAPLIVLLLGSHVLVTLDLVHSVREQFQKRTPPISAYTWIEDDVPEFLPLPDGRSWVTKSIEESVRYGIHESEAYLEWLYTQPVGEGGNVRLGADHRLFVTSISHQNHCLLKLRTLLDDEDIPDGGALHHAEHCLSFLRQHSLCAADAALEPGDSFSRNYTSQRVVTERRCMRPEPYYEAMRSMWMEWVAFRHMSTNHNM